MQQYMVQIIKNLKEKGYRQLNPESNNVYGRADILHAGERAQDCAFAETERRCRALYGLFRENGPAEPAPKSRVYVQRD